MLCWVCHRSCVKLRLGYHIFGGADAAGFLSKQPASWDIPRETSDESGTVFSDICWCPKVLSLKQAGNQNLLHLDKNSYIKRVILERQAIMLDEWWLMIHHYRFDQLARSFGWVFILFDHSDEQHLGEWWLIDWSQTIIYHLVNPMIKLLTMTDHSRFWFRVHATGTPPGSVASSWCARILCLGPHPWAGTWPSCCLKQTLGKLWDQQEQTAQNTNI